MNKRSEVVYLHLKPGRYNTDLHVVKMAKSIDAQVDPGVVVVKARVSVPGDFFKTVMPTVDVEFLPEDAAIAAPEIEPIDTGATEYLTGESE